MNNMDAKRFYSNLQRLEYIGNCSSILPQIQQHLDKSVRADYNKIRKKIKEYLPDFYNRLSLDFPNPYSNKTYRSRDGRYVIITHSLTEYLFETL